MSGTCSHRADSSKRCTSTTLVTTQMLTQMLLATVSLCVLCETAVRSRPCAQLLPQRATSMRRLMRSELHARPTWLNAAPKAPRRGTKSP